MAARTYQEKYRSRCFVATPQNGFSRQQKIVNHASGVPHVVEGRGRGGRIGFEGQVGGVLA